MNEGTTIEIPQRLPIDKRNPFQVTLMKMMLGEDKTPESKIEWADKYGKIVSDIIDDSSNGKIRSLIMEEKYKEAAVIVANKLNPGSIEINTAA